MPRLTCTKASPNHLQQSERQSYQRRRRLSKRSVVSNRTLHRIRHIGSPRRMCSAPSAHCCTAHCTVPPVVPDDGKCTSATQAYRLWLQSDHEYLFYANNDVLVPDGAIDAMAQAMSSKGEDRGVRPHMI
jgi:hypothetical protein